MAKKNRNSLKNAFRQGAQPTESSFGDLIDSALNVVDDGFDKTDKDGFKITQLGNNGKLMSFCENVAVGEPVWSMRLGQEQRQLIVGDEDGEAVLTLSAGDGDSKKGRVGINRPSPTHELDVDGVVASRGRIGGNRGLAKADGEWYDIAGPFDGCRALEIMAGVGEKERGRYALLHATAINTFNSNPVIDSRQSHFGDRCDKIELRWAGGTHAYTLQIRTRCAYGEKIVIQYFLTDLWFDPFMQLSDTSNRGGA